MLKPITKVAKRLNHGILVPAAALLDADGENQIFFGFDEVWFFPHDRIEPKPDSAWLVGPNRLDQEKLDKLGSWMTDNGCSMGIGDGCGLNIVTKAAGLMRYLVANSMSQPQPIGGGELE